MCVAYGDVTKAWVARRQGQRPRRATHMFLRRRRIAGDADGDAEELGLPALPTYQAALGVLAEAVGEGGKAFTSQTTVSSPRG